MNQHARKLWFTSAVAIAWAVALASVVTAERAAADDGVDFFEKRIRPILHEHCRECHGPRKQKAGLRLDARSMVLKGGESGPAVVPGNPNASRVVRAARYTDRELQMPPKNKLPDEQIKLLERWVQMGAPWTEGDVPDDLRQGTGPQLNTGPPTEQDLRDFRANHWSMQPITKPTPPKKLKHADWVTSPIDRFVVAKLESKGLTPGEMADRGTLIRRAYFDLIGLPPTFEQVEAFVHDKSPDAFTKVVDELLARPQYGERWGRHWLDVARYADTRGYLAGGRSRDYPFAWTYRDYVIDAFNSDKPFDRFVMEQLAADRMDLGDDKRPLAALGFLTVGRRFSGRINDIVDDRIDVITRGLLGLTVSCARCHDHKYDPLSMADYYGMYGILRSSSEPDTADLPVIAEPKPSKGYDNYKRELAKRQKHVDDYVRNIHGKIAEELRSRAGDYLSFIARTHPKHKRGDVKLQGKGGPLRRRGAERWKHHVTHHGRPADQDPVWAAWGIFADVPRDQFAAKVDAVRARFDAWEKKHGPMNRRVKHELTQRPLKSFDDVARAYGDLLEDVHRKWKDTRKKGGNAKRLPDDADEQLREHLYNEHTPPVMSDDDAIRLFGQGERNEHNKRRGKVDQLRATSPHAPPRAMVLNERDRPYQPRIFKRGNDNNPGQRVPRSFLGVLGHIDDGGYETGGRLEFARAVVDPKNPLTPRVIVNRIWQHHFGRGLVRTPSDFGVRADRPVHPELLDYLAATFMASGWSIKKLHRAIMLSATYRQASTIRPDCHAADPENNLLWRFNRQRLDFEPMRDAMLAVSGRINLQMHGRPVNVTNAGETRRSVYAHIDRQDLPNLFRTFDFASPDASTAVRPNTTVPQQSLFMLNSPFIETQVNALLNRSEFQNAPNRREKVAALYRLVYARTPSDAEVSMGDRFVADEAKAGGRAWVRYTQALLLSNEFVFVD